MNIKGKNRLPLMIILEKLWEGKSMSYRACTVFLSDTRSLIDLDKISLSFSLSALIYKIDVSCADSPVVTPLYRNVQLPFAHLLA